MLQRILAASLRHRELVLVTAALVCALGVYQVSRTPIDVLPDLDRPIVSILTDAHGFTADAVEQLVTWPIEQAVAGATGVLRVRSTSTAGFSVVAIDFDWGTDILDARQIVGERLGLVADRLPEDVQPQLAPIASIMGQIQIIGFRIDAAPTGDATSDPAASDPAAGEIVPTDDPSTQLRRLLERDVQPRLRSLPGVAQTVLLGGQPTEVQVVVDAAKLRAFDLSLVEVAQAIEKANALAIGTTLEMGAQAPLVAVHGRILEIDDVASAIVRDDGQRPLRVRDVAQVVLGASAVRTGSAGIDGSDGVMLVVTKQPGTDTVALTRRVDAEVAALAATLPEGVHVDPGLFRQADFIERAITNVREAIVDGALLVVLVLFGFLLNFRTTAITLLAIPLSVATAALVFAGFGLTINTMTLGGLAIAIGTLVDDAIVDVENVYRRLRQNAATGEPKPTLAVVLDASTEIRRPVLYGTLLVSVVYLPLFFLSGVEGRLLAPVGLAFLVSVAASLIIAMTVTPVLCSYWLGGSFAARGNYGSPIARGLRRGVARFVRFGIDHARAVIAGLAVLTLCAVALLASRGATFLPPFQEGSAQVNLILPPDVSLATSDAFARRLEQVIASTPGVATVARRTGRAPGDEHAMPINVSEAIVRFDEAAPRDRDAILDEVRDRVAAALPGCSTSVEQPLAHLLSHLLSGVSAHVAVKISGPDLDTLRQLAKRVEGSIEGIEGVRDLYTDPQILVEQVEVRPRREALARLGISVEDVAETVELALGGHGVSKIERGRVSWPIVVRLRAAQRAGPEQIANLLLPGSKTNARGAVRLRDVADVVRSPTPNQIQRENGERRIVVQHNVADRALGDVVSDVETALAGIRAELPSTAPGSSITLSGTFEAQQDASRTMLGLSLLSILAMVFILHRHFGSVRTALIVLSTRPVALLGAAAAVVLTGQDLSVATLVGLIALLGIAVRNAILYVDAVDTLADGGPRSESMLLEAARDRVVPVLMTALTSGIGLLPLALTGDQPGREILYPVATVILGGLVSGTLLDFLVLPGLLLRQPSRNAPTAA